MKKRPALNDRLTLRPARSAAGTKFPRQAYGFKEYSDLFTARQLIALTTFSDLVGEARAKVLSDALASGMPEGEGLEAGGTGANAYADSVATYLGFAISRMTNKACTICSWDSSIKMEAVRSVFARQALQMSWDFAESNPWGSSGGDFVEDLLWISRVLDNCSGGQLGIAQQSSAGDCSFDGQLISTDPPYYDNIGYSDLSDFFMFGYAVRFGPSTRSCSAPCWSPRLRSW